MLDGDEAIKDKYDPFNPVPEPDQDKEALIRSLELAQKWTLLFVVCNSAEERNRLMDEVAERLPQKKIQWLPVAQEVGSLSDVMREHLPAIPPDVLFIYGIERWLSGAVNPRSVPFLLNLNAARDVFPEILHGPMVIWLPQFALEAIANAAPDFFSVRSGVYTFPVKPDERLRMIEIANQVGHIELLGLPEEDRTKKILAMESILSELQALNIRDMLEEARVLNQLGLALQAMGNLSGAYERHSDSLKIRSEHLPAEHEDILTSLGNTAAVLGMQGRYVESKKVFDYLLDVFRRNLADDEVSILLTMNSLAFIEDALGNTKKSVELLMKALSLIENSPSRNEELLALIINGLATMYSSIGLYGKACVYGERSLAIAEKVYGMQHPSVAIRLINLSDIYLVQGRVDEAKQLLYKAVDIVECSFEGQHPTKMYVKKAISRYNYLNDLAKLYASEGTRPDNLKVNAAIVNVLVPMQQNQKKKRRK